MQKPPIRGAICDLRCSFSNFAKLFQSKVMCEILLGLVELFKKKKKKITMKKNGNKKKYCSARRHNTFSMC